MKKLFMVLCVVIMFFGIVSCNEDDSINPQNTSGTSITKTVSTSVQAGGDSIDPKAVPEPATLILLGSGLVGLAGAGRKKFFKKDQDQ